MPMGTPCASAPSGPATWLMLVYRSGDLIDWQWMGELTFPDDRYATFGYMWECRTSYA